MKIMIIIAFASMTIFAQAQKCKPQPGDAKVEQERGVYIFVASMPAAEYTVLGTVKAGSAAGKWLVEAAEYSEKKNRLVKKALKEYPEAEGVILYFNSLEADTADAIKFSNTKGTDVKGKDKAAKEEQGQEKKNETEKPKEKVKKKN